MIRRHKDKPAIELTAAEKARSYDLRYKLTYDEAYEAFYLLADKWGKKWRWIAFAAVGVAAVVSLVLLIRDPLGIQYSMLTILCAIVMLLVLYGPTLKARRGAKAVMKSGASFQYKLCKSRGIVLPNNQTIALQGDPDARAIESGKSFIIRANRQNSFCIPKRILKKEEVVSIRRLLYSSINNTRLAMPADTEQTGESTHHATNADGMATMHTPATLPRVVAPTHNISERGNSL